ncbi:hypothetical protein CDES_02240 [Corynebacterium deserti GIMN1.010]|uniref:DUF559 domain-containing protein n=2 Tax=Corynebacterium TaxID=1716 RepID=A0A0M3Q918_9CORY|nr:hypothetical protein CDES_02240 [Corynebacterium deserti GIMN1.010]
MSKRKFFHDFTKIVGDIYLRNDLAKDPRNITKALLRRSPNGVVRGYGALAIRGFSLLTNDWEPIVGVPELKHEVKTQKGKILRREEPENVLRRGDVKLVDHYQALRDVFSLHGLNKFEEQVALIDHLGRQNHQLIPGLQGKQGFEEHRGFVNIFAESPPESIVRVRLYQAGMWSFFPQLRVDYQDAHYFLDLGDPLSRIAIEYNGAWHYNSDTRAKDSLRKNALKNVGWDVYEITAKIVNNQVLWERFLAEIRRARDRKLAERRRRLPISTVD